MRIISQVYVGDGKFMLQLGGLSKETKPTDSFVANGSQFVEDDTDAVFSFNGTWTLDKNGQMKDLPVVTATDNGKILKVEGGVWSLGEDGGLPIMTGKNGKVLGVTLDAQDHEQAEWVTPSGGGAEKFVVTFTTDGTMKSATSDKAYAELVAANEAGKYIVADITVSVEGTSMLVATVPLDIIQFIDGRYEYCFTTEDEGYGGYKFIVGVNAEEKTVVTVNQYQLGSTNAPLIVTLTEDQQNPGTYVGDKTYKEVYDAFIAGKTVVVYLALEIEGNPYIAAYNVVGAEYSESEYSVVYPTRAILTPQGSANDYLTITLGS